MKHFILAAIVALGCSGAMAQETPSPEGARVYIVSPAEGAVVKGPVTVVFGL